MEIKMQLRCRFRLALAAICAVGMPCAIAADHTPIRRADSLPDTTPWDLETLSNPPEFEWAAGEKVRSLYYQSEPYRGKTTRVFAYYATPGTLAGDPTQDKNLPGIILVHGGSGFAFSEWAELWASRGYAAIAMDLCGYGPDRQRLADGGPSGSHADRFGTIDQPITSQWSYHGVANVIRAHSLLLSFSEVDSKRTAMTGISWGGYLTCIVAGLDNRFKAAVPVYGCGFLHKNSAWLDEFKKMSDGSKTKWVQLWDPSQYVGSATMPMLFVNGGKDFCYRTDSYAKTYSLVRTATKNIRFSPSLPHGHIFDRPREIEIFINHHLNLGIPLAKIMSLDIGVQNVTARVKTAKELVSAQLYYTTDSHIGLLSYDKSKGGSEWEANRSWIKTPASIDQNLIMAKRPPPNATAWFLTVTDERQSMVSSEIILPEGKGHNTSDAGDG
jgi:dienelactone hydrolase